MSEAIKKGEVIEAVVEFWHIKQRNTRRPMQCRTTRAHHINIVGYSSGTRSNVLLASSSRARPHAIPPLAPITYTLF